MAVCSLTSPHAPLQGSFTLFKAYLAQLQSLVRGAMLIIRCGLIQTPLCRHLKHWLALASPLRSRAPSPTTSLKHYARKQDCQFSQSAYQSAAEGGPAVGEPFLGDLLHM